MTVSTAKPPIARREEDRFVYAGAPPPGWPADIPRQAEGSTEKLVDPPLPIPDPYGWLRDDKRENEEVIAHLKAENEYTKSQTDHLEPLRQKLYDGMLASIQETDYTVPRPRGNYYRYSRTYKGKSYRTYCRAPREANSNNNNLQKIDWDGSIDTPILKGEEILLDENELAKGKDYCSVGALSVSPSENLLAYSADFSGNERYLLYVQDLTTKEIIFHDPELEILGGVMWGKDDSSLFYCTMDGTRRPDKLWRKRLNKTEEPDELIKEEKDPQFWSGWGKTLDEKYLLICHGSSETSEVWYLDLEEDAKSTSNKTKIECIAKRRYKVLYEVDHRHGYWWISSKTGDETPNMRLFIAPVKPNCENEWELVPDPTTQQPLFDGGYDRSLEDVSTFDTHVIAHGREGGIPRVWVMPIQDIDGKPQVQSFEALTFEEEAYCVGLTSHYEFKTPTIMVVYDSLITPPQYMEISLADLSQRTVVKQKKVPGYNKEEFDCDRYFVTSRDGTTQIPVLTVYRKDAMQKHKESGEPVPTHITGYGAYGSCEEAEFYTTRLQLLNRGVVIVNPQIRGGGEMGRQWYEEPNGAKYLCKKNTFNDFVDVARHLVETRKFTIPDKLTCEGRSAGGMLIGASINQAPELFKAALLGVPFVDCVATMIDSSIPLTTNEWEEWGNVNEEKYCKYMMEYCPMQNVKEGAKYPACLLTCGFHDPRVGYWEAAKFAALLRHKASSETQSPIVKVEMAAGHFSASDRYKYYRELSFDYAFLLDQLGLAANSK